MVAVLLSLAAALIAAAAELLHARRIGHLAALAFGPKRRPALWTYLVAPVRVAAYAGLTWGLITLLQLPPKVHKLTGINESDFRDLLLVLDVSPSMRLADAGPKQNQTRRQRAADLLQSIFERSPMELYRTSIIAFYTEALPVVERTTDPEVVRNVLEDLPLEYAFKAGPTDLLTGIQAAARMAQSWRPNTATLIVVSDGDTIPPTGLPKLPVSIGQVVVLGVGDVTAGRFISGHLSRQDASSLRQLAIRLGGTYHDGNEKHLSTEMVRRATVPAVKSVWQRLTWREYALLAIGCGATVLAVLPWLLHLAGTSWRPGVSQTSV